MCVDCGKPDHGNEPEVWAAWLAHLDLPDHGATNYAQSDTPGESGNPCNNPFHSAKAIDGTCLGYDCND